MRQVEGDADTLVNSEDVAMNPLAARIVAGSMLLPPGVLFIAGFCIVAAIRDPHRKVWRGAFARYLKAVKKRRVAPPFALRSLIFFLR
jgi:hypothetical protein